MTCFLTSSPFLPNGDGIDPSGGLKDQLTAALPQPCSGLFISSEPDDAAFTGGFAAMTRRCLENEGIRFSDWNILDGSTASRAGELVGGADLVVLAGGHVPTQNAFFRSMGLNDIMSTYSGSVLGISAGTMNSAELVYAQPELEGEATDPEYSRFLPGLGLTDINIIPHYQATKNNVLDGFRLFEDITLGDSMGRRFYALPDGSWLFIKNGKSQLMGESWIIENGTIRQLSSKGDIVMLT